MNMERTKVTKEDLAISHKSDGYVYSADRKRLISFPFIPEDGEFYTGTYHISSSTKVICDNACDIDHCSWLFTDVAIEIRIPEGVTHLGDFVFRGRKLDIVEIPRSLSYIGKNPFALTSIWKIINHNQKFILRNDSLIDIEIGKLIHNISDEGDVVIDDDIKSIGEYSFSRDEDYYRTIRTEEDEDLVITIPSTVQEIGDNAFENSNVASVIFLGMPNTIGKDIFKGCSLLKEIHVHIGFVDVFKKVLHKYNNLIDSTGNVVNGIVYRNLLASNGITSFYKLAYDWNISIYAFIKDNKLHFSNENGSELRREDIDIKKGILVLDLKDDVYSFLSENEQPGGKALAIDGSNNISWLSDEEDFYFYITDNQILIHQNEYIRDMNERIKADKDYEDRARFFGNCSDKEVTAYNNRLFVYDDKGKKRVIYYGKQYPEEFDKIEVWNLGNEYTPKNVIIVCISNEWGMITLDNNYIKPQYKSIRRLFYNLCSLYIVEDNNCRMGVMNGFGDIVIDVDYDFLEAGDMSDLQPKYVVVTNKNINTIFLDRHTKKHHHTSYCEIPEIEKCKIKKWGTKQFSRFIYNTVESAVFLKVVKEDGKEFIFDNRCNDITNDDEFYEWREDDWEDWEWY